VPHMFSYQYVKQEHPGPPFSPYLWAGEYDFEEQVREWLFRSPVTFLVDDAVFYRPATEPDRLPWSHRRAGGHMWRAYPPESEEGYPLSVVGDTYGMAMLLPVLPERFPNVTALEAGMAGNRDAFPSEIVYGAEQDLCVIDANKVSEASNMPHMGVNVDGLLERYMRGERIDLDALDFSTVTTAHCQIPFVFTTTGELERRRQAAIVEEIERG
jgi:hypothetical protein